MAGGRNLLKVGQVFQFVGQRFFFKLPTDHFFLITLGHETWWPTFFNCDNFSDDNLQKRDRLTYQLSSGGVGRGKDEGPFFFHHPEKGQSDLKFWSSTKIWWQLVALIEHRGLPQLSGTCVTHKRKSRMSDYPARALRALGLLLADGTPTVGGGKTFWAVSRIFLRKQL